MNSIESTLMDAIKGLSISCETESKTRTSTKEIKSEKEEEVELFKTKIKKTKRMTFKEINTDKKKITNFEDKNLSEWNQKDFANYMSKKYSKKYNSSWIYSDINVVFYLSNIKEAIHKYMGIITNKIIKDYIDFYYDNYLDFYRNTQPKYWLMCMKQEQPLKDFIEKYDMKASLSSELVIKQPDANKEPINDKNADEDMEKTYLLGIEALLIKYGIFMTINYLTIKKEFTEEKALNKIAELLFKAYNMQMFDKINKIVIITQQRKIYSKSQEKLMISNINNTIKNVYGIELTLFKE